MPDKTQSKLDEGIGDARKNQGHYSTEEWSERLEKFLNAQGLRGQVTQLKRPEGGASSASIIFTFQPDDTTEPARKYVGRLESTLFSAFSIIEQFSVQKALFNAGLPVAQPLWLDDNGQYLGRKGFVMVFAEGTPSSPAWFNSGPLANLPTNQLFRMIRTMTELMAEFHYKATPALADIAESISKGRGNGWIERDVNMWVDLVKAGRPEVAEYFQPVADWLIENAPAIDNPVIVHGDFQGSNVLWEGERISALMDFESVRLGPREHDIAYQFSLDELSARYWGELDIELPSLAQRVAWYEAASKQKLTNLDYHETRAVFQLACSGANLARDLKQDLIAEPSPLMDHLNRRVLALLPKSVVLERQLPTIKN